LKLYLIEDSQEAVRAFAEKPSPDLSRAAEPSRSRAVRPSCSVARQPDCLVVTLASASG
jgi:hypothetical protein